MYGSVFQPTLEDGREEDIAAAHFRSKAFALSICLIILGEGYDWGVMNGAAARIKEELGCSTFEIAIMVGVTPFGFMFGAIVAGQLADFFGRRKALIMTCALLSAAPIGMALVSSVMLLISLRFCVGCGIGGGVVIVSAYISEITPSTMRGQLVSMTELFLNIGMVLGYVANFFLLGVENDWRWMVGLGAVFPLLIGVMLCFPFVPESPRWLYLQGKQCEAREILKRFVGVAEARSACDGLERESGVKGEGVASWGELFRACGDPPLRRMILAAVTVGAAQTMSGFLGLSYFSSKIFKTSMSERNAFLATMIMGVTKLVVCILVLLVLERVGRRPMILVSLVVTTVASALIALAFQLSWGAYVQVAVVCLFMAGFSLGLGPLTFMYISEVYTSRLRAKGISFALFLSRIFGIGNVVSFPLLVESMGVPLTFWFQCASNAVALAAVWMFVRETHGHSIESMYKVWKDP